MRRTANATRTCRRVCARARSRRSAAMAVSSSRRSRWPQARHTGAAAKPRQPLERLRSSPISPTSAASGTDSRVAGPAKPRARAALPQSPTGPQFAGAAPPIKPEFKAAYQAEVKRLADAEQRGEPTTSQNTMCLPQGMPGMMLAIFPMEVIQTREARSRSSRRRSRRCVGSTSARMPPKVEDAEPGFYGHSGAKWDGDTLVAETVGIKTNVLYRSVPHSENMRIHERMQVLDADHWRIRSRLRRPAISDGAVVVEVDVSAA